MKFKKNKRKNINREECESILSKVKEYNIMLGMSGYRLGIKNKEALLTACLRKELDKRNINSKNTSIEISSNGSIIILAPEGFIKGDNNEG